MSEKEEVEDQPKAVEERAGLWGGFLFFGKAVLVECASICKTFCPFPSLNFEGSSGLY